MAEFKDGDRMWGLNTNSLAHLEVSKSMQGIKWIGPNQINRLSAEFETVLKFYNLEARSKELLVAPQLSSEKHHVPTHRWKV